MITSEELVNLDILPKKISLKQIIKSLFYLIVFSIGLLFVYSIYAERDFYFLITLQSMNFLYNTRLLEIIYNIDSSFESYNKTSKFSISLESISNKETFVFDYISRSLPVLIKDCFLNKSNQSHFEDDHLHLINKNYNDVLNLLSDSNVPIEKRRIVYRYGSFSVNDFNSNRHSSDYGEYEYMSISKYIDLYELLISTKEYNSQHMNNTIKVNQDKDDFSYSLNDFVVYDSNITSKSISTNLKIFNILTSWYSSKLVDIINMLDLKKITFSMSTSLYYSKTTSDHHEKIICVIDGGLNIITVSGLQLNGLYPYNKSQMKKKKEEYKNEDLFYSPVNLYTLEYSKYPNYKETSKIGVNISVGSCFYIPSMWFYQFHSVSDFGYKAIMFLFEGDLFSEYIIDGILSEDIE